MKKVVKLLLLLFLFSCSNIIDQNNTTKNNDPGIEDSSNVKTIINFRTLSNIRDFFDPWYEPDTIRSIKTAEEKQQYIEEVRRSWPFYSFDNFSDSMILVLSSPEKLSLGNSFSIDSIYVKDSTIYICPHIKYSFGQLSYKNHQVHIVVIPKSDYPLIVSPIQIYYEEVPGQAIEEFERFYVIRSFFSRSLEDKDTLLFELRNQAEHESFDDTLRTGIMDSEGNYVPFPSFSYQDSMLVGIIMPTGYSSSDIIEIVGLSKVNETINIYCQGFYPSGRLANEVSICWFIKLKTRGEKFRLFNFKNFHDDIE